MISDIDKLVGQVNYNHTFNKTCLLIRYKLISKDPDFNTTSRRHTLNTLLVFT